MADNNIQKKYTNLLSNTVIFAIGSLGSKLITFFLVPLYTNILSRADYGTSDLVINCANILIPVASLVIQDAIIRFGLSSNYNKSSVIKNGLIVFLFGSLFIIMCTPLIGFYNTLEEWRYYLITISITNMGSTIFFACAKAKEENKLFAAMSLLHTLILVSVNILLLVIFKTGVKGYLVANIAANIIPTIILFFALEIYKDLKATSYDKHLMKQMLMYSVPLIANNLSWWVLNSADRVMIERYSSESNLGLYTAASKIPGLLSILTSIFSQAWTISSIKEYDSEKDKNFYSNVFSIFSLAMFLGTSTILIILKPFMSVYVGKEFQSSWIFVPPLLIGSTFFSFGAFFGAIYGALKKNIGVTITTLIAATINILINFALIPIIGVMAASISTAISYITVGLIRMIHSRKYYSFYIDFRKFTINSIIVCSNVYFAIVDFHIYIISILCVAAIVLLNKKEVYSLFDWIVRYINSRFRKGKNNNG